MKHNTSLPISLNSYNRFVGYINSVFANDPMRKRIIKALDRYLEGDTVFYLDRLPRQYRMSFQMLIFEIDKAMTRSAIARRPRPRKAKTADTTMPRLKAKGAKNSESSASKSGCLSYANRDEASGNSSCNGLPANQNTIADKGQNYIAVNRDHYNSSGKPSEEASQNDTSSGKTAENRESVINDKPDKRQKSVFYRAKDWA